MDDIEGLKLEDKIKLEEYRSLLEEHRDNRLYLFERPIIILGIIVAAMAASLRSYGSNISSELCLDIGLFVSLGLIILLCFNLRFTANRLERDARIVAYMQLVHEGNGKFKDKWYGWGNSLCKYHEMKNDNSFKLNDKSRSNDEPENKNNSGNIIKIVYYGFIIVLSLLISSTFVAALTDSNTIAKVFIDKTVLSTSLSRELVSCIFICVAVLSLLNYFIVSRVDRSNEMKFLLHIGLFVSIFITLLMHLGTNSELFRYMCILYSQHEFSKFSNLTKVWDLQLLNDIFDIEHIISLSIIFLIFSGLFVLYFLKSRHTDQHQIWRLHSFLVLLVYVSFILALCGSFSVPVTFISKLSMIIILFIAILVVIYFFIIAPEDRTEFNVVYRSYHSIWKLHLILILIITVGSIISLIDSMNSTEVDQNATIFTPIGLGFILTAAIISIISFFIPLRPEKCKGLIETERDRWQEVFRSFENSTENTDNLRDSQKD